MTDFNYDNLREFIRREFKTNARFAEFIGIGTTQLYARLGNRVPFNQKEIDKVSNYNGMKMSSTEIDRLFFTR